MVIDGRQDASPERKSNKHPWLVKEQEHGSTGSPSRSCGCACVCLISLQSVLVLIQRLSCVKEAELCPRTGKPNSDAHHVQSPNVTRLGGGHKEGFVFNVEEWCQTPGQKDCGPLGNEGTERGGEFQAERNMRIISTLPLGKG